MLIALYPCKSLYISNLAARLLIIARVLLPPVKGIAGSGFMEVKSEGNLPVVNSMIS